MTEKKMTLPNWLKNIFDFFIKVAFLGFFASSIYVYFDFAFPNVFIGVYIALLVFLLYFIYLFRNKIYQIYINIYKLLEKLSDKQVLVLVMTCMVGSITFYTLIAGFDSTRGGDISIYVNIAEDFVKNGFHANAVPPYLVATGIFLSFFNALNIPYQACTIFLFCLGTYVNYASLKYIIGKENAALCLVGFLLMPSIGLWSLCVTHEIFLYFFSSLIFYAMTNILKSRKTIKIRWVIVLSSASFLVYMISPLGMIVLITLIIIVLFLNFKGYKKIFLCTVLLLVIVSSGSTRSYLSSRLLSDDTHNKMPLYWTLFVGSNIDTNGRYLSDEHELVFEYIDKNDLSDNQNKFSIATKALLIDRYKKNLESPFDLIKMYLKKFYIAWSGNFYAVELSHTYRYMDNPVSKENIQYLIFLGVSSIIYIAYLVFGLVGIIFGFGHKIDDDNNEGIYIYKCMLLGVIAVLLLSEIMNKYSSHQTLFIFMIAISFINQIRERNISYKK